MKIAILNGMTQQINQSLIVADAIVCITLADTTLWLIELDWIGRFIHIYTF